MVHWRFLAEEKRKREKDLPRRHEGQQEEQNRAKAGNSATHPKRKGGQNTGVTRDLPNSRQIGIATPALVLFLSFVSSW